MTETLTTVTPLEASLAAICSQHGLLNIGITYHHGGKPHSTVSLQWPEGEDRGCVIGHGASITSALSDAVNQMLVKRSAVLDQSEALQVAA